MFTPQYYTIVSGRGESKYKLAAFDQALLDAGIGDYNLVKVSSIIPAGCIFRETIDIAKGSILYSAYAKQIVCSKQIGSTAVGVAFPLNTDENGVIFENSSDTYSAESIVRNMCREAMNNRERAISDIKCSSIILKGVPNKYVCGISAVVMW